MSAHPFRRLLRNVAAAPFVAAGTRLTNLGVRTMWPDDRPKSVVDDAIERAADALEGAADRLTVAMTLGLSTKHQSKAFRRAIGQFLDLRALALGDTGWLAAREAEKEQRRAYLPVEGPS